MNYKNSPLTISFPVDFPDEYVETIYKVRSFTLTSQERLFALIHAVEFLENNHIEGDIVECGVWKGGSMMAVMDTLLRLGKTRNLWLYDTFTGMSAPEEVDVNFQGMTARKLMSITNRFDERSVWCVSALDEVKNNLSTIPYPAEKINFIKGKVEDTIPANIPQKIALLRLDTDFYSSTKHELVHLFPLLSERGIIIIDDYGHWKGAKKAVDEYFSENNIFIYLHRIDYTGRIGMKITL